MRLIRLFVAFALLTVTSTASAAIITAWDTNGLTNYGADPFNATTIAANVSVTSTLARGSGITTPGGAPANVYGGEGFSTASTLAAAVAANEFFTLSIDANSGFANSYSSIAANFRRSGTGPNTFQWQFDVGSGFTDIGSAFTYSATDTNGAAQSAVDLTGFAALQGVESAVTFRLVAWGATSTAGSFGFGRLAGDDLVFNGEVSAVPEPSSLFLVGTAFAMIGGIGARKRGWLALVRRSLGAT